MLYQLQDVPTKMALNDMVDASTYQTILVTK